MNRKVFGNNSLNPERGKTQKQPQNYRIISLISILCKLLRDKTSVVSWNQEVKILKGTQ